MMYMYVDLTASKSSVHARNNRCSVKRFSDDTPFALERDADSISNFHWKGCSNGHFAMQCLLITRSE